MHQPIGQQEARGGGPGEYADDPHEGACNGLMTLAARFAAVRAAGGKGPQDLEFVTRMHDSRGFPQFERKIWDNGMNERAAKGAAKSYVGSKRQVDRR